MIFGRYKLHRATNDMMPIFTARRMTCMHGADYAVARCLSVSVHHTPGLCLNDYKYTYSAFQFFRVKRYCNIPTGTQMQGGMKKLIFDQYLTLSWK